MGAGIAEAYGSAHMYGGTLKCGQGNVLGQERMYTVKTWVIGRCSMSLDFPLSVRPRFFFPVSQGGKGQCFCLVFAHIAEKRILDDKAHRPIIQVIQVR